MTLTVILIFFPPNVLLALLSPQPVYCWGGVSEGVGLRLAAMMSEGPAEPRDDPGPAVYSRRSEGGSVEVNNGGERPVVEERTFKIRLRELIGVSHGQTK